LEDIHIADEKEEPNTHREAQEGIDSTKSPGPSCKVSQGSMLASVEIVELDVGFEDGAPDGESSPCESHQDAEDEKMDEQDTSSEDMKAGNTRTQNDHSIPEIVEIQLSPM
jgi:hypothetical protein